MKPQRGSRTWEVEFHDDFIPEYSKFDLQQKKALLAAAKALGICGPAGGRPLIGTLGNPKHPNMKELRYDVADGTQVWRAAFAFDPNQRAIVLVAADKQGKSEKQFYKDLLKKANKRFDSHLKQLKASKASDQGASNGTKHQ